MNGPYADDWWERWSAIMQPTHKEVEIPFLSEGRAVS